MLGRKPGGWKEGANVFMPAGGGRFVFGAVTGVDGGRIGINGLIVDPVGLRNKVGQGKAGPRSAEILENPTPGNVVFALIYRVEHEGYTEAVDAAASRAEMISPRAYAVLDGWIREELPEMVGRVLSLPPGPEREAAKRDLDRKSGSLLDRDLRRNLYSVCRSLRILSGQ